jgi:hypothetical protein
VGHTIGGALYGGGAGILAAGWGGTRGQQGSGGNSSGAGQETHHEILDQGLL